MKRLFFSDLHLNKWSYGASITDQGFNTRLWQQWLAAKQMIDYGEEHNVKYVYFCGDLFHTHGSISTEALHVATKIFDEFRKRGIKIRAIPGNHDMADKQGRIHGLSFLPQDEISGHWVDDDVTVNALPYTRDEEEIKRFLGGVGESGGGMVLLHQGVAGVPMSSGYLLDEALNPEMVPDNTVAFTGHYHFHRLVSKHLTVVGNLTPLNWSDIDQVKGWMYWDDSTGEFSQVAQTESPLFTSKLDNVEGCFVRYTEPVSAGEMDEVRDRLIGEGALAVQFSNWKTERGEQEISSGGMTVDSVLAQFDQATEGRRREVGTEVREGSYNAPFEV